MLFVVDVGNSNTVLGLYEGDVLREHWRVISSNHRTADELRVLYRMLLLEAGISRDAVTGSCISSVVPQLNNAFLQASRDAFAVDPVMVGPGVKTGLVLQVENPKEVGADRIVNSVGALETYGGPLIVIDFGTATTFDVVTANAEWRGGIIVPGVQLAADALFEHCAKLPRVELTVPPAVIGRNTVANIRSGLTYGYADLVDGLIRRIRAEMGAEATVVATGGLAATIAEVGQLIDEVDPFLTLKGLKAIYHKNVKAQA